MLLPALVSTAARVRDRRLVAVSAAALVALAWGRSAVPFLDLAELLSFAVFTGAVFVGLPVAAGAYLGTRRDLLVELRSRAERAETEQHLRAQKARVGERARIAQEMHDVLAHKISLVVLHAGALEVQAGASPAEVQRVAGLIRTTARQSMEELRGVLGVLRTDAGPEVDADVLVDRGAGDAALGPQPALADVARLVAASAEAGVRVRLQDNVGADEAVPSLVGRTAYRVVQEGLTNVHKHAVGAAVVVVLSGGPEAGLTVEVRNVPPVTGPGAPLVPGAGMGLEGLRERVRLAGGDLRAGTGEDGGFSLRADLPWPGQAAVPGQPAQDALR